MAANPTHEKKRVSTPGNFDMFFQTKTYYTVLSAVVRSIESCTFLIHA